MFGHSICWGNRWKLHSQSELYDVVTMRAHTPIHDRGTEHETLIQHLQHPLKRNKRQKSELGSLGNVYSTRGWYGIELGNCFLKDLESDQDEKEYVSMSFPTWSIMNHAKASQKATWQWYQGILSWRVPRLTLVVLMKSMNIARWIEANWVFSVVFRNYVYVLIKKNPVLSRWCVSGSTPLRLDNIAYLCEIPWYTIAWQVGHKLPVSNICHCRYLSSWRAFVFTLLSSICFSLVVCPPKSSSLLLGAHRAYASCGQRRKKQCYYTRAIRHTVSVKKTQILGLSPIIEKGLFVHGSVLKFGTKYCFLPFNLHLYTFLAGHHWHLDTSSEVSYWYNNLAKKSNT